MIKGQVIKAVAGAYTVLTEDKKLTVCSVRKKVKNDIDIFVGDYVEISEEAIEKVLTRKNYLIRPYVANIDCLIIVVAKTPEPDWLLVEKLLLNCHEQNITPLMCVNKCDLLTDEERKQYAEPYEKDIEVLFVSAKTLEGIDRLKQYIATKTVCFAGQSAVGKTSIVQDLGINDLEIGSLSARIKRGKNTTRQVEIFPLADGFVVDTCGFSVLTTIEIKYDELPYYYNEYVQLQDKCKYVNCTHTTEPDCEVKKRVELGQLNSDRYDRYVLLYNQLKEKWRKRYE